MVFSDTTNLQGIVQDIDFLASSNISSYPLAQKTANVNRALDRAVQIILRSDGRWQWDDTNNTDLPIATTDLIINQQDYSFDSSFLDVTRVELKDSAGNWHFLQPFDQSDLNPTAYSPLPNGATGFAGITSDFSLTDFLKNAGTPIYYDKLADSVFLYPKPNYNGTASLKVYFQRKANYFVSSDTIKEAGIATQFHRYLSVSAAYDYALAKGLPKANSLRQEMIVLEKEIATFYNIRKKDEKVVLVARKTSSI
jgi:hypothetical protein